MDKLPGWKTTLIRRFANKVADILIKLGPPMEMAFTSSLPIHMWTTYSMNIYVQDMQRGSNALHLRENHILEQQQEQ